MAMFQQPQRPVLRLLLAALMELPERVSSRLMICGSLLVIAFAAIPTVGQSTAQGVHPVLRLEKPHYLLGESIRFWVGVDSSGSIPVDLRKPCSLTITKPNGNTEVQTISWPLDGKPSSGWSGGWGIKATEAGAYELELGCSGERTEPIPLIVETDEISHRITATFEFGKSGSIKKGAGIPVFFKVTNDSAFPIRFPQRGVMLEGISIDVKRDDPAYRAEFFYPWEKLKQFPLSPDTYTWDVSTKLPSITLEPGKQFQQRLALEDAYQFDEPGSYTVTFSTVVSVLVGDEHGPYGLLCPIRVAAEKSQTFTVSGEVKLKSSVR
jgi:hypothetical protein